MAITENRVGVTYFDGDQYVDPEPTLMDLGRRRAANNVRIDESSSAFDRANNWFNAQLDNERHRTRCVAQIGDTAVRFTDEMFDEYYAGSVVLGEN